jgi:uncharacterized protein
MDKTGFASMDKKMEQDLVNKSALCAFVKTPSLSPVKTRLCRDVGQDLAHSFYDMSVDAIEELMYRVGVCSHGRIKPFWSIAEREGLYCKRWQKLSRFWQNDGLLGDRLHQSFYSLKKDYDRVIMIGADSPHLSADIFIEVDDLLKNNQCVIGPSVDGGFYLFAASINIPKDIWTGVIYSKESTLDSLLKFLSAHGISVKLLELQEDVDNLDDLISVFKFFKQSKSLLSKQKKLYRWLDGWLPKFIKK